MESLKSYFKKVTALDHYLWRVLLFYDIPFIESRFYRCPFVKNICTKSTAINCLFKVNNESARTSCELCSKLTSKNQDGVTVVCSDVFIFNFEHFSGLVLCYYYWFWANIGLLGGAWIFRDIIYILKWLLNANMKDL